mmetsp:Transcript_32368/g.72704  ORF Transcript_32368/g.72704 Transcript_32368/m.72704 type:complete len:154 (-) Transcript_32368:130-591(-)
MEKTRYNTRDSLFLTENTALLKQKLRGEIIALEAQRHALIWGAVSYILVFSIFLIVFSLRNRKSSSERGAPQKTVKGRASSELRKTRSFSDSFNVKVKASSNSFMVLNKTSSGSRFYANQINNMRNSFDRRTIERNPEYSTCLTVRPFKSMHA